MIELTEASRWYGEVIGLNDVTCRVEPGITALLGQNGAGKTTMIRLITGQLRPTTGSVRVFGLDPFANVEVYRQLGYCPEIDHFYEFMTGQEFVYSMARFSGMNHEEATRVTHDALERVHMTGTANRKIAGYSKGMRQRIKLAQAMIHDPSIILLDEPLNGLDPIGRREIIDILAELADAGKVIVVSSHILFEVEQMTRNLLLLHHGRLLARGDLRVIRELIDKHPHRIRIESSTPRELAQKLVLLPYVESLEFDPSEGTVELQTREPGKFYEQLPRIALEDGIDIHGFASPDNNLESVFRYLVEA